MATPFEDFVNVELPKRVSSKDNALTMTAGKIPVTTGVGLDCTFVNPSSLISGGGKETITGSFSGAFTPFIGTLKYYPYKDTTLTSVEAWANVISTASVVLLVRINGVPSCEITLTQAAPKASVTVNQALTAADYLTVDVKSGNGSDAVVRLGF